MYIYRNNYLSFLCAFIIKSSLYVLYFYFISCVLVWWLSKALTHCRIRHLK